MSAGIRELLTRARVSSDDAERKLFSDTISNIFTILDQPNINGDFRSDLIKILAAACDLVETLSAPTYNVDEVLNDVAAVTRRVSFILEHISTSRPRAQGFGLVHRENGNILPNIWLQQPEAEQYVASMRALGVMPPSVHIIPIELSSRHIPRPRVDVPSAPPPVPPQSTDPLPRVLQSQDIPASPNQPPFTFPTAEELNPHAPPVAPPAAIPVNRKE